MTTIAIEQLTKVYASGQGVRDIDVSVEAGEIFGFIGKNGAGKSTTIRTALGLLTPTSGRVLLGGVDVHTDPVKARSSVGYVPSEPGVYAGMNVAEMLAYLGSFQPHAAAVAERRAELTEALDLDTTRRVDELSLGNKKKVALVAAMQHRPRVLVLDEPTSGLDPVVQASLFELLEQERDAGATVFFSSHVLAEVERVCDRIAIIKDGRIVETARLEELRAHQAHRVHATFGAREPRSFALDGVRDLERRGDAASFLYSGDLTALLTALAADNVDDLTIERPSLEALVIQHYQSH